MNELSFTTYFFETIETLTVWDVKVIAMSWKNSHCNRFDHNCDNDANGRRIRLTFVVDSENGSENLLPFLWWLLW